MKNSNPQKAMITRSSILRLLIHAYYFDIIRQSADHPKKAYLKLFFQIDLSLHIIYLLSFAINQPKQL